MSVAFIEHPHAEFYNPGQVFIEDDLYDAWAKELGVYLEPEPGTCVHCGRRVADTRSHGPRCRRTCPFSVEAIDMGHRFPFSSYRFINREDYP